MKIREILSERKLFYTNLVLIVFLLGVAIPMVNIVAHRAVGTSASASPTTSTALADARPVQNGTFRAIPADMNIQAVQSSFRNIVATVLPTVVEINVVETVRQTSGGSASPFDFLFGGARQQPQRQSGLGSGVIVKQQGDTVYVLTNNHVAGNADQISVKLYDGRRFKAKLVGKDPNRDLALIEFKTSERVPIAQLGDSSQLAAGDWVIAIGNPLGYQSTVTAGIVSALGRQSAPNSDLGTYTDYIQTDAAINPGNSGGALVNLQGQVVGVNTWIASNSGGSIGIGFAIPINNARKVMTDLIRTGHVVYGWTGINVGDPVPSVANDMNLSDTQGALVYDVYKNSPAYKGGLLPGDYITEINGEPVKDTSQLLYVIANINPGDQARFTVLRDSRKINLSITIGERQDNNATSVDVGLIWPGMAVLPITQDIQNQVGLPDGVGKVIIGSVQDGSAPAKAGFQPGDVIQQISGKNINSLKDFYQAIDNANAHHYVFKIYRNGTQLMVGLDKV